MTHPAAYQETLQILVTTCVCWANAATFYANVRHTSRPPPLSLSLILFISLSLCLFFNPFIPWGSNCVRLRGFVLSPHNLFAVVFYLNAGAQTGYWHICDWSSWHETLTCQKSPHQSHVCSETQASLPITVTHGNKVILNYTWVLFTTNKKLVKLITQFKGCIAQPDGCFERMNESGVYSCIPASIWITHLESRCVSPTRSFSSAQVSFSASCICPWAPNLLIYWKTRREFHPLSFGSLVICNETCQLRRNFLRVSVSVCVISNREEKVLPLVAPTAVIGSDTAGTLLCCNCGDDNTRGPPLAHYWLPLNSAPSPQVLQYCV